MPENKALITQTQSTSLVLGRTKDLLALTDKLLNDKLLIIEDPWWERLWAWADEHAVDDLYLESKNPDSGYEAWRGLPRDKKKLLELTELNFSGYDIDMLPIEIGNLTKLTWLALKKNKITELPKEIGNLTNLIFLDISITLITELPREIGNLTNLEILSMGILSAFDISGGTPMAELPKEIGNLTNLKSLDINDTFITELPREIGNLTNLKSLNISGTLITELPREIGNLTNLESLRAFGVEITELPKEIGNLKKLRELELRYSIIAEQLHNDTIDATSREVIDQLKARGCKIFI